MTAVQTSSAAPLVAAHPDRVEHRHALRRTAAGLAVAAVATLLPLAIRAVLAARRRKD